MSLENFETSNVNRFQLAEVLIITGLINVSCGALVLLTTFPLNVKLAWTTRGALK